jgi:hypothetical protein
MQIKAPMTIRFTFMNLSFFRSKAYTASQPNDVDIARDLPHRLCGWRVADIDILVRIDHGVKGGAKTRNGPALQRFPCGGSFPCTSASLAPRYGLPSGSMQIAHPERWRPSTQTP